MKSTELAKLETPKGWKWESKPTLRVRGTLVLDEGNAISSKKALQDRVTALFEWATQNKLGLVADGTGRTVRKMFYFSYYEYTIQTRYRVSVNKPDTTENYWAPTFPCNYCKRDVKCGVFLHDYCGDVVACQGCRVSGWRLFLVPSILRTGRSYYLCNECAPVCTKDKCKNRQYAGEFGTKYGGLCQEHCPVAKCFACSTAFEKDKGTKCQYQGAEKIACPTCAAKYICTECGSYSPHVARTKSKMCKSCTMAHLDEQIAKDSVFSQDELPKGGFIIKDLPERPYRLMSIETEMDGEKDILAGWLYRCGLVKSPEVESYHSQPDPRLPWAAHLKHDGSVTAGELIFHCMNLDTKAHADAMLDTLTKLKGLEKGKHINFGSGCGGHIHIDAHNFGYGDVWRLITVWNFLEDVIYRLAGAGHEHGHRSINPNYRPANGTGYSHSPVKGPFGSKAVASRAIQGQQRHSGLNFVPYIQAQGNCVCGAFGRGDDDGRGCTCNLGKRTIEWRVWNSTGNPRILHAWMALMQAVHSYCDTGEDPTSDWELGFTAVPFTRKKWAVSQEATTKERLEWIFRNLVLTDDERDSLVYTLKQSELKALGDEYLDSLLKIVPEAAPGKQAVKHHAKRSVAIKVDPPSESKKAKAEAGVAARGVRVQEWQQQFVAANIRR